MENELLYPEFEKYLDILKRRLSPYRLHHSMCVAEKCVELCEKYGGDRRQMYLAGLLHDITKESSEQETEEILNAGNAEFTELERKNKKVWHQMTGAMYVRNTLGIPDDVIYSSIRYHTTLHQNPTLEEKILFVADFTSADRDFEDVDVVREKAEIGLDDAIVYALSYTIKELAESERCIHPDTIEAYNYILLTKTKG